MVRKYIRKQEKTYDREMFRQGVQEVRRGKPLLTVAKEFNIPRNTIRGHLRMDVKPSGGQTVFTTAQEAVIVERLIFMCDRGFPLTIKDLRQLAFAYGNKLNRRGRLQSSLPTNWVSAKMASYDWWFGLKTRFPCLALRVAEGLSNARAEAFSESRVKPFFSEVDCVFKSVSVTLNPSLIYNCDEIARLKLFILQEIMGLN
jgi:hypothetical protein